MTTIGSLVFCNDCGNLLASSTTTKKTMLTCDLCGSKCENASAKTIKTVSKPSDFPSVLRQKHAKVQALSEEDRRIDAVTRVPCENCGNQEVRFYTQQLRSADEGTTVFYSCEKCGHAWNTNN